MTCIATERCSATFVDVDEVDARTATTEPADDRAQRGRRTSRPADDLAEVLGMDAHLEHPAALAVDVAHRHLVRMGDDAADEMLEGLVDHSADSPSGAASAAASAAGSAGSAAASAGAASTGVSATACAGVSSAGVSSLGSDDDPDDSAL